MESTCQWRYHHFVSYGFLLSSTVCLAQPIVGIAFMWRNRLDIPFTTHDFISTQ